MIAIIPARYSSVRLPGKLLLEVSGKPLIAHTVEKVRAASTPDRVIVAVDHEAVFKAVAEVGIEAVMTSPEHRSGSDRIAEVAADLPEDSLIVNVQGDEPLISPDVIDRAVTAMRSDPEADITTTCEPIASAEEVLSPDAVKVVVGPNGYAIYFSRSPVPYPREAARKWGGIGPAVANDGSLRGRFKKHTGLYVFRQPALMKFTGLSQTDAEAMEMLEQLRALENGMRIRVVEVAERSIGIDTIEDLEAFRTLVAKGNREPVA